MSKFTYRNREHVDVVCNYLALLNRGLKQRSVTLGQDETLLTLELPDHVDFSLESTADPETGTLTVEISWPSHRDHGEEEAEESELTLAAEALLAAVNKKNKDQKNKKGKKNKKKRDKRKKKNNIKPD